MVTPFVCIHKQSMALKTVVRSISRLYLVASQKMITLFVTVQVSTRRKLWVVWLLSTLHTIFCVCLLLAFLSFSHSKVLLTSVLKCFVTLFSVLFVVLSFSGWNQNMFALCCRSQYDCSFFIRAASVAALHERLPRDLQRVSLEWVWWVNFGSTSFFLQSV